MKILALLFLIFAASFVSFGQKADTMTIKVFFGNEKFNPNTEDCGKVYPVTRTVSKTKATATAALEELFKGVTPEEEVKGYTAFPTEEMKGILLSVKVKNKAAYVNFKELITRQIPNVSARCGSSFFFSQIENTLKQFPTVKKVFYAIEGKPRDFYYWLEYEDCPKELKNCSSKDFE